ncbi:MAG: outer membrane lipid asymmetry maintenance protein MlaD [Alphaproteobacteria bacterium]
MGKTLLETLIGALVLVVAIAFITMAYTRSDVKTVKGYTVLAQFTAIDGLNVGDDVRISGIKVGSVTDQTLDYDYYRAIVHMSIDPAVELPEDTTAAVVSEGLLGGEYVALEPGGDDELIADGGEITLTQSSVNLESLLGKFIYSGSSSGGGSAQ